MKKNITIIITILIILILIIIGVSYYNKNNEEKNLINTVVLTPNDADDENTYTSNIPRGESENWTTEKIDMTIKEGTLTNKSATIIIKDNNDIPASYGTWFRIDKKENGEWKEVDEIIGNSYAFTEQAISVREDRTLEMNTDWEKLYGELQPGEYRIVKERDYKKEKNYFYTEFSIK